MLLYEELSSQEQRLVRAMVRAAYYGNGAREFALDFPHVAMVLHKMAGQLLDGVKCGDVALADMADEQ